MTKQIEAETLREWLDTRQPVTVLDIRTDEDRAQWAIPGSVHVDAYGCPTGCRQSRRSWSGSRPSSLPRPRTSSASSS
jgi:rhodanese-related sulfurtransferase